MLSREIELKVKIHKMAVERDGYKELLDIGNEIEIALDNPHWANLYWDYFHLKHYIVRLSKRLKAITNHYRFEQLQEFLIENDINPLNI